MYVVISYNFLNALSCRHIKFEKSFFEKYAFALRQMFHKKLTMMHEPYNLMWLWGNIGHEISLMSVLFINCSIKRP